MGIIIAASITTVLVLVGVAILLRHHQRDDLKPLALTFLIALPLQPLVFYAIRLPLDGFLRTTFGIAGIISIISLFYAPLIEEPAKWLTAAVPAVRRAIMRDPITVALVAGAGFGIGEIWFLAHALVTSPNYPDLPVISFSGFMIERAAVCFLHGAFLAPAFYMLASGRPFWIGGLAGMVLHFLLNFPIFLARAGAFGISPETWPTLLVSWIFWIVVGCIFLVIWLSGRFKHRRSG